MRRAPLLAVIALATIVPGAVAHGGKSNRYRSTVARIAPPTRGITATVLEGDHELQLANETGTTVIVLGYENEPYLRLRSGGGVDVNARSPAATLNLTRYAEVPLPPDADPRAAPRWRRVASGSVYAWHDHRIHWMSTADPPVVRNARDSRHHIFDWSVPLRVDGRPVTVQGSLAYAPSEDWNRLWLLAPALAGLAGLAWLYQAVRRERTRTYGV